jgi:hypothetical protein
LVLILSDEERKLKLLRLLRDGKPLTPVLGSDVASPVPVPKVMTKTVEGKEEWEEEEEGDDEEEELEE